MESAICPIGTFKADADFRLIETFAFVPGQEIAHLDLHLARLTASAQVLGLPFDRSKVLAAIVDLTSPVAMRCRMTLDPTGGVEITTAELPPKAGSWRFAISKHRLDSSDLLLRHKTTRRALYDAARAALPEGVDELVFLNERGELCEGTITNIAIVTADGQRLTPPLSSGCLPGVQRQSLLDTGGLCEAVLTLDDLRNARSITLMNALRGEIDAFLVHDSPESTQFA